MQTVLVVIHLLIVIALVGVVLIQRSEGGGLGVGGGSGFMTARGTKNALTRLTAILACGFFLTSMVLVVMNSVSNPAGDILNRIPSADGSSPAPSVLEQLGGSLPQTTNTAPASESPIPVPQVPEVTQTEVPVGPAATDVTVPPVNVIPEAPAKNVDEEVAPQTPSQAPQEQDGQNAAPNTAPNN